MPGLSIVVVADADYFGFWVDNIWTLGEKERKWQLGCWVGATYLPSLLVGIRSYSLVVRDKAVCLIVCRMYVCR